MTYKITKMLLFKIFAISLAWAFAQGNQRERFLYKSEDADTLVVVEPIQNGDEVFTECLILQKQDQIDRELESLTDSPVKTLTEGEMADLIDECDQELSRRKRRQTNEDERAEDEVSNEEEPVTEPGAYDGWAIIFPGTKWCGAGDIAKNYDDLGMHQDTDRCCRAHDHCDDTMGPGETRNNLTNKSPFTKLSCKCDNDFYDCLDRVNSVTSNIIGNKYFNLLRRSCYAEGYPKKCKKSFRFLKFFNKCEEDKSAPKEYQWISARKYNKIPIPGPLTITLPF